MWFANQNQVRRRFFDYNQARLPEASSLMLHACGSHILKLEATALLLEQLGFVPKP
jgi:hypothetical protein